MDYKDKHITVLGCGASGLAAARLLAGEGAMVRVLDTAPPERLGDRPARLGRLGVRVVAGGDALRDDAPCDRAILSPGIPRSAPLVERLLARRVDMIGEVELAYELCRCPVIAVTGTNGKTTTTALVAAMLGRAGLRVLAGGNMSPPFSDLIAASATSDCAVIETSSFQLEEIRTFRPRVAVWLNFSPDHLDRYPDIGSYRRAKLRVFENQTPEDVAVVNAADAAGVATRARMVTFSALRDGADFGLDADGWITHRGGRLLALKDTRLRGVHNAENVMAALAVGQAWGMPFDRLIPGIASFEPARHRNELIATVDGVRYVNDSKSTNPSSLEMALRSQDGPVILIAGGKEKGFDFDSLAPLAARHVRHAVLIGQMAGKIERAWSGRIPCRAAPTLEDAVRAARGLAVPGDTVLLSPGTSSFDMFRGYEHRGDVFRDVVRAIQTNPSQTHP